MRQLRYCYLISAVIASIAFILAVVCIKADETSAAPARYGNNSGRSLSIEEVIKRSAELRSRRVTVRGYLVFEPENRNLWTRAEAYGEQEEPCISLDMTDTLYNKREAYNRRDLYVSGVVMNTGCDGSTCIGACNDVGLADVSIIGFGQPLSALSPVPKGFGDTSLTVNEQAPDASSLRKFGERLSNVVKAGTENAALRNELLAFVPEQHRAAIETALVTPGSRPNWLLFDGERALGRSLTKDRLIGFDVAQAERVSSKIEPASYLCYCVRGHCNPKALASVRVYFRAAADPYLCIPVRRERDGWRLDAGFLIGLPAEEQMH